MFRFNESLQKWSKHTTGVEVTLQQISEIDQLINQGYYVKLVDNKIIPTTYPKIWDKWNQQSESWEIDNELYQEHVKQAKSDILALINEQADDKVNQALSSYPQIEISSFSEQSLQAKKYITSQNKAEAPLLVEMARNRDMEFEELVAKVIEKSDIYTLFIGRVIGTRQRLEKAVERSNDIEELLRIRREALEPTTWR